MNFASVQSLGDGDVAFTVAANSFNSQITRSVPNRKEEVRIAICDSMGRAVLNIPGFKGQQFLWDTEGYETKF